MRLDLVLLDSAGRRLALPTNRARNVQIGTGVHGFEDLTAFLPLPDAAAFDLVSMSGLRALLVEGPAVRWEGRVEDLAQRNGGVDITALGDSRACDDTPYTALWSTTSVAEWEPVLQAYNSAYADGLYAFDTNNRLYITPEKGSIVGNTGSEKRGGLWYVSPHRGQRSIVAFSANYTLQAGIDWSIEVLGYNVDLATNPYTFSFVGSYFVTATSGSGSINVTFPGVNAIAVTLRYNAPNATLAVETGTVFLRMTNVRLKTVTTATVTADQVVNDLISHINAANPGALSSSTRLIVNPGIDLTDAVYQDRLPSEILSDLAAMGDSSGRLYEWGVYENRELFFRPVGSGGRAWAVDASELEIEQTLDGLINSYYAAYKDAGGRTLRTADQADATSRARYGRTRRRRVDVDTTNATLASQVAQTARDATSIPVPRSRVRVRRFATPQGAVVRGDRVRAGDTVTIRNLTPTAGDTVDRVRTFRVAETTYSVDTDQPEITPESQTPDIDQQIAFTLRRAREGR